MFSHDIRSCWFQLFVPVKKIKMISIATLLVFIALYVLYYTSKKAALYHNSDFEKWMKKNPKHTRIIGLTVLFLAYGLLLSFKAAGSATLMFFIQIMAISSLIIVLKPLKKMNNKVVFAIFIIASIFEFYYA